MASLLNNTFSFTGITFEADESMQDISICVDVLNKPSLRSFSFEYQLNSKAKRGTTLNRICGETLIASADLRLYGALRINENIENFSWA